MSGRGAQALGDSLPQPRSLTRAKKETLAVVELFGAEPLLGERELAGPGVREDGAVGFAGGVASEAPYGLSPGLAPDNSLGDMRPGTPVAPRGAGTPAIVSPGRVVPGRRDRRATSHPRPRSSLRRRSCNRSRSSPESAEKISATKSSWAGTTSSKSSRPSRVR